MENNQQRHSANNGDQKTTPAFGNQQPGQPLPKEERIADGFAETNTTDEQHSESSRPQDKNETLGTP